MGANLLREIAVNVVHELKIKREERKVNLVDYKYRKLFKYRPLREK